MQNLALPNQIWHLQWIQRISTGLVDNTKEVISTKGETTWANGLMFYLDSEIYI